MVRRPEQGRGRNSDAARDLTPRQKTALKDAQRTQTNLDNARTALENAQAQGARTSVIKRLEREYRAAELQARTAENNRKKVIGDSNTATQDPGTQDVVQADTSTAKPKHSPWRRRTRGESQLTPEQIYARQQGAAIIASQVSKVRRQLSDQQKKHELAMSDINARTTRQSIASANLEKARKATDAYQPNRDPVADLKEILRAQQKASVQINIDNPDLRRALGLEDD